MKHTVPKNLLEPSELASLPPRDRDDYTRKMILDFLQSNSKGATMSEIIKKVHLSRTTVTKQLQTMVSLRELEKEDHELGNVVVSVYKSVGKKTNEKQIKDKFSGDVFYTFYDVQRDQERFIFIQEKETDEMRKDRVRGAIAVSSKDFDRFIKELMQFAVEIGKKQGEQ